MGVVFVIFAVFGFIFNIMREQYLYDREVENDGIGSSYSARYNIEYAEKYKVFEKLPIESRGVDGGKRYEFKVIGGELPECKKNKEFCIKIIDIEGEGKERALEEIRKLDGNIDSYEIIYDDLSEEIKKYNESLIGK